MTEAPSSDAEIEKLAAQAGEALQNLQSLLGRTERGAGKVRFPRGFLHSAGKWRMRLGFIRQNAVMNNVAYTLMLHDVYLWLLRRTDLAGLARDMIVKASLSALGSIAEAILMDHYAGQMGARQRFTSRTERLLSEGIISSNLKDDLDWLWDMRCRQHLYELAHAEFDFYETADHKRAIATANGLINALNEAAKPAFTPDGRAQRGCR